VCVCVCVLGGGAVEDAQRQVRIGSQVGLGLATIQRQVLGKDRGWG